MSGRGPETPWSLSVRSPKGEAVAAVDYYDASTGSFLSWWWESVVPEAGRYLVSAHGPAGASIELPIELADRSGIPVPRPSLSSDGSQLSWESVATAASYACRVYSNGSLVLSTAPSSLPSCGVGSLAEGSYTASVIALNFDPSGLLSDLAAAPALPAAFHVAEGTVGFVRSSGGSGMQLRAAGGPLNFGTLSGGLALWMALSSSKGDAPAEAWTVSVLGPGISASSPFTVTYPAGALQHTSWSYDLKPRVGTYTVTAESPTSRLATTFVVGGEARWLEIAPSISATTTSGGAAEVSWGAVSGAASYRVAIWSTDPAATSPVAATWVRGSPARFPASTFQSDQALNAYVLAADADMTAANPSRGSLALSENAYNPVGFTAR